MANVDPAIVQHFGQEWSKFNHREASQAEIQDIFNDYFEIFPWKELPAGAVGFDLGCGSGRWARLVAPRVGKLHCIDPSAALDVARQNLAGFTNCEFHSASVDSVPLPDNYADFGYSLGVLHIIPDTLEGIAECVRKLKPGAPFLIYMYYACENRPWWFRLLWRISDIFRHGISRLPFAIKGPLCDLIAAVVYWPMAKIAKVLEKLGANMDYVPLSYYRNLNFYTMRNDSLDRFGTKWEQRYTRDEMLVLMEQAGLERISFSDKIFWCAVGYRKR